MPGPLRVRLADPLPSPELLEPWVEWSTIKRTVLSSGSVLRGSSTSRRSRSSLGSARSSVAGWAGGGGRANRGSSPLSFPLAIARGVSDRRAATSCSRTHSPFELFGLIAIQERRMRKHCFGSCGGSSRGTSLDGEGRPADKDWARAAGVPQDVTAVDSRPRMVCRVCTTCAKREVVGACSQQPSRSWRGRSRSVLDGDARGARPHTAGSSAASFDCDPPCHGSERCGPSGVEGQCVGGCQPVIVTFASTSWLSAHRICSLVLPRT